MDLTQYDDKSLRDLRSQIDTERERRAKLSALPLELASMARDAVAAGCDPEELRSRVDEALTPAGVSALAAVPTELGTRRGGLAEAP